VSERSRKIFHAIFLLSMSFLVRIRLKSTSLDLIYGLFNDAISSSEELVSSLVLSFFMMMNKTYTSYIILFYECE
jgi:hypothetical protein